jgi:hypothetical protein
MGILSRHATMIPTTRGSKVRTTVSSGKVSSASKHHKENVPSRGGNRSKATMGSGRIPSHRNTHDLP